MDGYNWYAYCGNDPVNMVDPSGLFSYEGAWNGAKKGWDSGEGVVDKVVQAGLGWFIGGYSGGKGSSSKKEETQTTTSSTTQGTTQGTTQSTTQSTTPSTTQSTTQTTTTPTKPLTPEQIEDYRMQDKIMNLLNTKYSKEAWEKATDKEQFLRDLLSDCNSIMGTNVAGIEFIGINGKVWGAYIDKPYGGDYKDVDVNTIVINTNYLEEGDYHLVRTIVHETRHAYQYEAIAGDHPVVSQETIDKWSENMENYIKYSDDKKGYYEQAIEWDAKAFAGQGSELRGYKPKYAGSWTPDKIR